MRPSIERSIGVLRKQIDFWRGSMEREESDAADYERSMKEAVESANDFRKRISEAEEAIAILSADRDAKDGTAH